MLLEQGLRRSARLWPDKIAVIDENTCLTYEQLGERVDRLANMLRDLGVERGDRVGVLMVNSARYPELYYGINLAGGVIVPLNFRLAVPELEFILDDCVAKVLIVGADFVTQGRDLRERCRALTTLIHAEDGPAPEGFLAYEDLLAATSPARPPIALAETDMVGIFYTGGTTGRPKGVMLSQRNLSDNALRGIIHFGVTEENRYLHAAPMFHIGDGSLVFTLTIAGGTNVIARAFQPAAVLETIARERVTDTFIVPTMINGLVNHPDVSRYDLSSLHTLIYGASPIASDLLRRAMAVLPGCQFVQGYGMTETAPILTALRPADHRSDGSARAERRLLSAGTPAIGIEVRVVDSEDRDVPLGTVGEVLARGDNIMLGYWNRPAETAEALRGGWFHTGDLATMDEDGYLYIVDRKKDMIISGGENVYSVEVEEALSAHPAVLECAVIGVPDERWGEVVFALVVPRPGESPSADVLIAHCRERIASYKVPKAVVFAAELPKSAAGKILKRELRERYRTGVERNV